MFIEFNKWTKWTSGASSALTVLACALWRSTGNCRNTLAQLSRSSAWSQRDLSVTSTWPRRDLRHQPAFIYLSIQRVAGSALVASFLFTFLHFIVAINKRENGANRSAVMKYSDAQIWFELLHMKKGFWQIQESDLRTNLIHEGLTKIWLVLLLF